MSVYFAEGGGYIKIGYSADPFSRVSTITTAGKRPDDLPRGTDAKLLGWIPGDEWVEGQMHARFIADRVAGEWFRIDLKVVRDLIWNNPRGVDIHRMSATTVFAAKAHPEATRDALATAGIRIEAASWSEALENLGSVA